MGTLVIPTRAKRGEESLKVRTGPCHSLLLTSHLSLLTPYSSLWYTPPFA